MSLVFGGKNELVIGREDASDIKLDGLQISNRHARLLQTSSGVAIEDLGSTNGVFVNEKKITKQNVLPTDAVYIGSFLIKIDNSEISACSIRARKLELIRSILQKMSKTVRAAERCGFWITSRFR